MMDENTQDENQDLKELQEVAGVSVWSQNQETIEKQALEHYKELTLNKNRDRSNDDQLEEGEISDHSEIKSIKNKQVTQKPLLDIDQYIRNQTVLKSLQCSKKRLDESSTTKRSKSIAERISENQKNKLKSRQKTKKQVSGGSFQNHDKNVQNTVRKDKQYDETGDAEESGSEYVPSEGELDDYCNVVTNKKSNKKQIKKSNTEKIVVEKVRDDGDINVYKSRIERLNELKVQRISSKDQNEESEEDADDDILPDKILESGLKVPGKIWNRLYRYQRVGVKWMSELNEQRVGGLLGDEMGLGKTVQVIAFLAALDNTKTVSTFGKYKGLGPTLIICPATVLHQWVRHFHEWWPTLRVAVLHQSGTFHGQMIKLIKEMNKSNGVLLTTYQGVLRHKGNLVELQWHYVILDEGHKIRNPNAKVTVAVKQFKTPHRLVLTGSPMQNNLTELWSLFDFITPGKLGSQQVFLEHFATPIIQGGYTNASPMQEATALSIATALKDAITPYMLRRAKLDLRTNIDLPNKNEQVLFCGLTREQYDLYKGYLMAEHVGSILGRDKSSRCSENMMRAKILMALTILRKICNHPDLYLGEIDTESGENANVEIEEKYGYFKRAGKMVVVANLLRIWKRQEHRVLLFNQTRGMIEIFEEFLRQCEYKYLKMDGTTSIGSRQPLIDKFNNDPSYFVFLLTTRVGGLGVNLTGANRVIIYDPDWNPATDTQARERAWRIGQEKNVTVYRLLSAGTIEEKIYQRQVWKQLLSNKILVDPRQRRFFRTSDLHDLFSIQDRHSDGNIETANIFKNSQVELMTENSGTSTFTKDKIEKMKLLAQKLSKKITSSQTITKSNNKKPNRTESLNDPNEIWDPDTVRFKKRRKIRIPAEEKEMNLIDNSITNLSFTAALNVIDEQIIQNSTENSVPKVSNTIDKQCNAIAEKCNKIEEKSVEIQEEHLPSNTSCNENVNSVDEVSDQKNLNEYDGKKQKKKHEDTDYKHRKRKREKKIDSTGCIDGEKVENLVKREKLKTDADEYTEKKIDEKQDEYVLSKLLSKGVTALKHDAIIQSGYEDKNSIRVRTEAQRRTEIALKALRKSRLRNWRW